MNKQNKGITLVALVITIIVLIILAAVSINAVMNDGLIGNAKEAKLKYENATKNEQADLETLLQEIESAKRTWVQTGTKVTDGTTTFDIGQTVTYTPNNESSYTVLAKDSGMENDQTVARENLTWRVLGVNENGRLELISTQTTGNYNLYGKTGAENATWLNDEVFNKLYGDEETITRARAMSEEDFWEYQGTCDKFVREGQSFGLLNSIKNSEYFSFFTTPSLQGEEPETFVDLVGEGYLVSEEDEQTVLYLNNAIVTLGADVVPSPVE